MKKLAAIAALSLVAVGAQAQTYQLSGVTLSNPFGSVTYGVPGTGFDSSAQMVVSGTSVTGDFGLWHDGTGPGALNAEVDYSGNWSTTVGSGVNILKNSETCYDGNNPGGMAGDATASRICGGGKTWTDLNGWEGDWINGQNRQGGADARYVNNVTISGTQLIITSQSQFTDNPTSSFFNYPCPLGCSVITATYDVVPVPAAAWLFGSAVGLMGWLRRRSIA